MKRERGYVLRPVRSPLGMIGMCEPSHVTDPVFLRVREGMLGWGCLGGGGEEAWRIAHLVM